MRQEGIAVRIAYLSMVTMMLMIGMPGTRAQDNSKPPSPDRSASRKSLTPEEIIQQFAKKETEFYEAWIQYMYTQTAEVRVLSDGGVPKNERLRIISEVVFNDDGSREVRTVRRSGGLQAVGFTDEDRRIMENIHPFALSEKEIPLYNLKYEGKEKVDELECHVFSVKPKKMQKGQLYFQGQIWVDDQDLQIVRTVGKAVPQTANNQFPEFETIRQVIDSKYWFPVWTHADSNLNFGGRIVRIEETITYDDYKKFRSKARILSATPSPDAKEDKGE
jgi:hypothetical protein